MTKLIRKFKYCLSFVMTTLLMVSFNANSSHIKCIGDYAYLTEAFIGEADCELGLTGNDTGTGDVNDEHGMFLITEWEKLNEDDEIAINSGISPNDFSIDPGYFASYDTFMLTFKSANKADPDKYVGYLLDVVNFSLFNWVDAMFKKTSGEEGFNGISHINLYGFLNDDVVDPNSCDEEPCSNDIPEPNVIFIFGLGLLGLFIKKRLFK